MTGTPSGWADWLQADAEDQPTELLASRLRAGHPDLPMRSGAFIEPGNATVNLASARDGTVVGLRPLRRDERELVARFFALVEGRQRLPPGGSDPTMVREVTWAAGTSA